MDDRLHAILIEPQLARFRDVCDLNDTELEVNFNGWHRHAILSPDRVFLFPRHRQWTRLLLREATILEAIAGRVAVVPRLLGQWRDDAISPYPFIATSRLPGRAWGTLEAGATLDQWATMLANLGRTIATWHSLDVKSMPPGLRRRPRHLRELGCLFDPGSLRESARRIASHLDHSDERVEHWLDEIEPLRHMTPVLVHGDVHEDQILVDDNLRVTGVLDWETGGVGHPLKDFDFGEWGFGIFGQESQFDALREAMWNAYAGVRGGDLPQWTAVHRFFCLTHFPADDAMSEWDRTRRSRSLDLLRRLDEDSPR
jgi:aminoglycoside phosphotransferase (APT) family kinase protein